jgi:hypothetical protein
MPALHLYLQPIGAVPDSWYETTITNRSGVWFAGQTTLVSNGGSFMLEVAERLIPMFDTTLRAGNSPFTTVGVSTGPDRTVGSLDLLCYVCRNTRLSIIKQFDPAGYKRTYDKNARENGGKQVDGLTVPLLRPDGSPGGVCSEVFLDMQPPNINAVVNNIYHEWMHNKTNYAIGEDANWVHTQGGGGLANTNGSLTGLTSLNASKMCSRLSLSNRQFVDGIPIEN